MKFFVVPALFQRLFLDSVFVYGCMRVHGVFASVHRFERPVVVLRLSLLSWLAPPWRKAVPS